LANQNGSSEAQARNASTSNAIEKQIEELQGAFNVLARNFLNIFLISLEDGSARVLKLDGYVTEGLNKENQKPFEYPAILKQYISDRVYPEDQEMLHSRISLEALRTVFAERNECTGNYRALVDGETHHYQYNCARLGNTQSIIAGFQNIDDIIEENNAREEAHRKEVDEQQAIVNTLASSYRNVYVANLDNGATRVVKLADDYKVKAVKDVGNQVFFFDNVVDRWVRENVHPDDKKRIKEELNMANLNKIFAMQNEFTGTYQSLDGDAYHYYQYDFRKIEGTNSIVAGFKIVDDIVKSEKEQQERLSQALTAAQHDKEELLEAQTELRDSMAITDALSRDYSNVFLVQPKKNLAKTIKAENYNVKGIDKYAGTWFDYSLFIRKYIEARVYEPDAEMMLRETELGKVLKEIETNTDFSIPYRAFVNDEVHYLQMRYVSVEGADLVAVGFRYVDDLVRAEAKQKKILEEALAAAQQANKAKTTFLNSMSHDIRTPMNAIIGFTALAQTHLDNPEQVEDYLGKISTSSTHLLSLINDILDMSRIESGTVKLDEKPLHIPDLLHDLRAMIQGLINSKNQNLYIDTQDVAHEDVITDKLRLNQVLINIVGNAIKFTQPGGDVIIRLIEKPCSIKHHTTYEFSVKDNGIGMSEEFQEHIFDTFSREYSSTVSGEQGTGLGMAITKNIVEMMGGEIKVQSVEGRGSIFTVTLNLRLANEPVINEPIPELLGARALVVDDDLNTCLSVSKMLRDIKMRPDWTASGKEAIVRAQDAAEMKDEYQVYIIDYLMPDMNGIETVRRIRKVISEEVPIIVLTAYDWADFEIEAREAGVTAFVSKPIFMSELREVLTTPAISEAMAQAESQPEPANYSGKHVLLAEDNELNREIAVAILEETGMEIDTVNDGDEAVSTIMEAPEGTYDLVLMDIQMPRMDGYTATREIRTLPNNEKANIPIVAMTANAFDEDRKKALECGMNGHIIKPISIDAIAEVLDEVFEKEK
jgi:signal transduction histidine kinase/DNA-binding response OmpR family regulator